MNKSFRFYYDKSFEFLYNEEIKYLEHLEAEKMATYRLRMYANLFNRDMRKKMINNNSKCCICNSKENLQIDHIVPISKGGRNIESNIQILCFSCNREKSNKL